MAIAFNPRFEYSAVDVDGDVYIVAADLLRLRRRRRAGTGTR